MSVVATTYRHNSHKGLIGYTIDLCHITKPYTKSWAVSSNTQTKLPIFYKLKTTLQFDVGAFQWLLMHNRLIPWIEIHNNLHSFGASWELLTVLLNSWFYNFGFRTLNESIMVCLCVEILSLLSLSSLWLTKLLSSLLLLLFAFKWKNYVISPI